MSATAGTLTVASNAAINAPPKWYALDTETNATATARYPGAPNVTLSIQRIVITFSATIASPLEADVKFGNTTVLPIQISTTGSTGGIALDLTSGPLTAPTGSEVSVVVPTGGSGIVTSVWMCGTQA